MVISMQSTRVKQFLLKIVKFVFCHSNNTTKLYLSGNHNSKVKSTKLSVQFSHNLQNLAGLAVLVSWQILKGYQDFLHTFSMALHHKWNVKNGISYVITFFSLIFEGLGGVLINITQYNKGRIYLSMIFFHSLH